MSEKPFTTLETAILDQLATYQFLTALQLITLGVNRDRKRIYTALAELRRRRPEVVRHLEFGSIPGRGRLADLYALTPHGADVISELYRGSVQVPVHKRVDTFKNDYWHRVWCVDFHIAARAWAASNNQKTDFFYTYYDPGIGGGRGKKAQKKTRIAYGKNFFEPDAIFQFTDEAGTARLFVYELYVGTRTKRVEDQLRAHLYAMGEDAVETAYEVSGAARHLVVFDDQSRLDLACNRLRDHPWFTDANEVFFLSTRDNVKEDFLGAWQRFDGEVVKLF